MAGPELHDCPKCQATSDLRKVMVLPDGETVKKVWLCTECKCMFVTVSKQKVGNK
jgi:transcriptional regulator NrdR family protein